MNILVLGGTRFFGIHMVRELLQKGHDVTIATRGQAVDDFGDTVKRITVERTDPSSLLNAFDGKYYDVVLDNIAYCSNDVKYILDSVKCKRYILMSSASVYKNLHIDTKESDFNPIQSTLKWCSRMDFPYDEIKRQAECALFQEYSSQEAVAVRYPYVIGEDDYTKRLYFYVEHIIKGVPMFVDNRDSQLGFIRSDEAGKFLAYLAEQDYSGTINGNSHGTISISEMVAYVEKKTGKKAIFSPTGEEAPYNQVDSYSLDIETARSIGFDFSILDDWIYDLLDKYIENVSE